MKTLTPTDRQRLSDSLRKVEGMAHSFFYAGADWDTPAFPPEAAARLNEMARLLMAEHWMLKNLEVNGG